ncbi:hypothetical protein jhhlp_001480 [Lomentospora prolificans]|uniref:BZIP domain-containing protein n=1 Tax=Lomentospora prolificans TaxID=41688 RepID=A0A2N3NIK1_9PEZI|nr:hypothetical protein jhhlp_001480 [Lomentospora prolificans]
MANSPDSISYSFVDPNTPALHAKDESQRPTPEGVVDTPGPDSQKRRPQKKPRSVANMTQEQRERKRENDRVAQRAIREKTKQRIAQLEAIIDQLKSSDHNKELQAAIQAKEAVEAENAEIKRQLAGITATLQQLISPRPGNEGEQAYASPASQVFNPPHPVPPPAPSTVASTPPSIMSPGGIPDAFNRGNSHTQQHSSHHMTKHQQTQSLTRQREDVQRGLENSPNSRFDLSFLVSRPYSIPEFLSISGDRNNGNWCLTESYGSRQQQMHNQIPRPLAIQKSAGPHQGYTGQSTMAPSTSAAPRNHPSPGGIYRLPELELPLYATPVKNNETTCLLDDILLKFLKERRDLIAQGQPREDVVGPKYPSVSSLLNKDTTTAHPLSSLFTAIIGTFPDLSRLPEQLGVVYMMFLLMRWQVEPSKENYERLPPWLRPLPIQLTMSHPAWLDHVPWPLMRERMVKGYHNYLLENYFIPYTSTISCNWPYDDMYALIRNPDTEEITINPVFDQHVRNLDNWSLGEAFKKKFPELIGTYTYRNDPRRP